MIPPEICQSYALCVYSIFFFILALMLWVKKRRRLNALTNHKPCITYLRMRLETAKLFDSKENFSSSAPTTFDALTLQIRYALHLSCIIKSLTFCFIHSGLIKEELELGFLASVREKHWFLEKEIGLIFKTLEEKFDSTENRQSKLRKAMVFEANDRLMRHPYDIIGLRRLKLFENSLKNYLENEDTDVENWLFLAVLYCKPVFERNSIPNC